MKIQLIKTEEVDGNWFKILANRENIRCVKYDHSNESEKLIEATAYFLKAVERAKNPKTEVLKEEEI